MPKKLLFISSTNLTTNPRISKELKYAVELEYEVDFIGFKLGNWSDEIDKELIKEINANFHYISITRKPFFQWFFSSVIERFSRKLYPLLKNNLRLNAYAHSKRSFLLTEYLRKNKNKYDIIIAHTLPTLYPAYKFAESRDTSFTFDIEDYHPGENISSDVKKEKKRREFLLKTLLPKANYVTYASPLIGKYSLDLCDNKLQNHILINNCFYEKEFQYQNNNSEKVKFVWFSQNIAAGRGLELLIPVLFKFKDKVKLHLIGNLYQNFYDDYLSEYNEIIKIHAPIPQKKLNLKLSEFDVGLAIELNSADFNRQICLTNKIWAYFQSGFYILATDTPAQIQFLEEHKNSGEITEQSAKAFEMNIEKIISQKEKIRSLKKKRFEYAKQFSWEIEKNKLHEIWNT